MRPPKLSRGFTLIELLVVISIISLLSSVILATINSVRDKGDVAAGKTFSGHTRSALFDSRVVFIDFDDASYSSEGSVTAAATQGSGASLTSDTDLYGNGSQMTVVSGQSSPGMTLSNTAIGSAIASLDYSFSVWFKPTETLSGSRTIIGASVDTNVLYSQIYMNGMRAGAFMSPNASNSFLSGTTLKAGKWHNLTLSVREVGTNQVEMNLYVNGKLATSSGTITVTAPGSSNNVMSVASSCCSQFRASGVYDEVALYSSPLNATQVAALYEEGVKKYLALGF
jgi:prepilin-type N-terminal cleavage/methylation domain-containing protein